MQEIVFYRGPAGEVERFGLPLSEPIQGQVTRGVLRRCNEDGSEYREQPPAVGAEPSRGDDDPPPAPPVEQPPAVGALKAEWVGYAVRAHGLAVDDAEAMTKQDLIDRYGPKPVE